MIKNLYRGDIVYISLPQQRGSIQAGFRPCVVVSNNKSNKYSKIVNLIPFSSKIKHNPVHVKVHPSDVSGYFEKESDALVEQIVTRSIDEIVSKVGHLNEKSEIMRSINRSIALQLGITSYEKEDSLDEAKDK